MRAVIEVPRNGYIRRSSNARTSADLSAPDLLVELPDGSFRVTLPSKGISVNVRDHTTAKILAESELSLAINKRKLAAPKRAHPIRG